MDNEILKKFLESLNLTPAQFYHTLEIMEKVNFFEFDEMKYCLNSLFVDDQEKVQHYLQKFEKNGYSAILEINDIQDLTLIYLYLTQKAFNRETSQERDKFNNTKLPMTDLIKGNEDIFWKAFEEFNMLEEISPPENSHVDVLAFLGASAVSMFSRSKYLEEQIGGKNLSFKKCYIMAGDRDLTIGLDGIDNIKKIAAHKFQDQFHAHEKNEEIKIGDKNLFINNKLNPEIKLIETDIGHYVRDCLMSSEIKEQVEVVHSQKKKNGSRPDTYSNARDLFLKIVKDNIRSENQNDEKNPIDILLLSAQPYCDKQKLMVENKYNKMIAKDKIDLNINLSVMGSKASLNNDNTLKYFSELAGFINEYYKSGVIGGKLSKVTNEMLPIVMFSNRKQALFNKFYDCYLKQPNNSDYKWCADKASSEYETLLSERLKLNPTNENLLIQQQKMDKLKESLQKADDTQDQIPLEVLHFANSEITQGLHSTQFMLQ